MKVYSICVCALMAAVLVLPVSASGAGKGKVTDSGLRIEELKAGDGKEVKEFDLASIFYTLRLADGTDVESNRGGGVPFEFLVGAGKVIKGMEEGVLGMKQGGKRRLTIPPELGYGARPAGRIPPNSTLVFDIELVGVTSVDW